MARRRGGGAFGERDRTPEVGVSTAVDAGGGVPVSKLQTSGAAARDNPDFSIGSTIDAWIARGAPRGELVLGIPYYGQGWTGVSGGLFGTATGPAKGTFADGTEDWKRLKELPKQGYRVHRDRRAGHSYLYDGTTFRTYDDPAQILQKAAYIRLTGLGGAMMWSLDGDDDNATLTRTISAGLWTPRR